MATIPEALNEALRHHQAGRLPQAEAIYRQILQVQPNNPDALNLLGVIAHQVGKYKTAVDYISQAIRLNPHAPEFHNHLGIALKAQNRLEEAVACYQWALALKPDYAEASNNLGDVLRVQGKLEEAVACLRRAVTIKPDFAMAHNNLGITLFAQWKPTEAELCFRQALALKPAFMEALTNLGVVLKAQGKLEEAVACYRQALAIKPDFHEAHSNLVCVMNYVPAYVAETIAAEHQSWNARHAQPLAEQITPHENNRDAERRLRVGYVSADFWMHPVSNFVEPFLAAHDRAKVEVFCYSSGVGSDPVTSRLRALADAWRDISGVSDEVAAELIRSDRIDILVDLSGHTCNNRLLVFARKPAPVQVSYLGYPRTTGVATIDYVLTDRFLTPTDSREWFAEEPVHLPGCIVCYQPPAEAPPVEPLPAVPNGHVTFGSFNNLAKVNASVVELWAEILRAVPGSRIILKWQTLADPGQRTRCLELFGAKGIDAGRVELCPRVPMSEHLTMYGRVDVALDPFPYNGCTTTCEALWMGVPVVTLAGETAYSRYGVSLLSAVGLQEFIAETPAAYVSKAVEFAGKREQLAALRSQLRARMAASVLCSAKAFTLELEKAYRHMWRRWCQKS